MTHTLTHAFLITTLVATTWGVSASAHAQVAGSTTVGVSVTEISELATGWSAKRHILGKPVYNQTGDKIGVVEDLIIAPNKSLTYLIVGVGGFLGMGRHDVALPSAQVQDKAGRLVMPGATKAALMAMPAFEYALDTSSRDQFIARAGEDVSRAKAKLSELNQGIVSANGTAKQKLEQQVVALKTDLKSAEDKLGELNRAGAAHWKQFEGGVSEATARLRKWFEKAT